ncbi:MAG: DUF4266 domain-containing protein [Gammaproteobacteria bacterium]|nr:DUF4266 domain-containing protein [Gammaproteobacteria bacterium]NNC68796.1 DUF4266 domain-containing protein [Gammaproteobacteria bacterium]
MLKKATKVLPAIFIISILISVSACSSFRLPSLPNIEPWVAPYEREYLADPIMSFNKDPLSNKYRQHVFNTREGARGAGYAHGGGCGCN